MLEQFAPKKKNGDNGGKIPAIAMPKPPAPNERHAQALTFVADLTTDNDFLRTENGQLRAELNIAKMRIGDLERDAGARNFDLEGYRRYSVEVKTHLQHIIDACHRANEAALEAGENRPPLPPMDNAALLKGIDDITAAAIGAKFGAGTDIDAPK